MISAIKTLIVHDEAQKPIYPIIFSASFDDFEAAMMPLTLKGRRVCIVTDSCVGALYLDNVKALFADLSTRVISFVFTEGEANKNLQTIQKLYEKLILNQFDRNDLLVALGGGVVGDLTGFAAATYLRGIDFVQIPTTLLSQVDSSIGGKTGVDFDSYKNMVGAFHQPKLVYMNLSVLKSLNERQYYSGMGEIIKHGLIKDKDYFTWIKTNYQAICNRDPEVLKEMIYRSCNIKRQVVENDPKEQGERALLNFGHTLGHAIEKLQDFNLLHGECVALGMIGACAISMHRGWLSRTDFDDIITCIRSYNLFVPMQPVAEATIVAATKNDKKMDGGKIKFVLLHSIGEAFVDRTVTDEELLEALNVLKGTYRT